VGGEKEKREKISILQGRRTSRRPRKGDGLGFLAEGKKVGVGRGDQHFGVGKNWGGEGTLQKPVSW